MVSREIVSEAALLMDKKLPGWWNNVDVDALNMANPCKCVMGQQPGGYDGGMVAVFADGWWVNAFSPEGLRRLPLVAAFGGSGADCWRHEIALRRLTEAPSVPVQPVLVPAPTPTRLQGETPSAKRSSEPSVIPEPVLEAVWAL